MKATLIVAVVIAIGSVVGVAQGARTATLDDVVNEIHALRAELNQTASVTVRTQLLVARLQLQEQRIASIGKQLQDAQAQLANVQPGNVMIASQIKDEEERLGRAPTTERAGREDELKQAKLQFAQMQAREQALRNQIGELTGMLSTEQNRWSEFNDRIDALERSLK